MRAGELRHRVTIQRQLVPGKDDLNADIIEWADIATVWAAVEPLTGREYFAAQQVNAEITVRVRIRYLAGVNSSMRVKFGARYFYIEAPPININERNRELVLMCKEAS